jgi:hypothetical protein
MDNFNIDTLNNDIKELTNELNELSDKETILVNEIILLNKKINDENNKDTKRNSYSQNYNKNNFKTNYRTSNQNNFRTNYRTSNQNNFRTNYHTSNQNNFRTDYHIVNQNNNNNISTYIPNKPILDEIDLSNLDLLKVPGLRDLCKKYNIDTNRCGTKREDYINLLIAYKKRQMNNK